MAMDRSIGTKSENLVHHTKRIVYSVLALKRASKRIYSASLVINYTTQTQHRALPLLNINRIYGLLEWYSPYALLWQLML